MNIKDKFKKDKYLLSLIVLIAILSIIIYYKFITLGKIYAYKDIGSDTINAYIPTYKYLVQHIKSLDLDFWTFNQGVGSNIFTIASGLFDPFILILVLFPLKYMLYGLVFISILKIFVSGIIFYMFMNKLQIKKYSALIPSLLWAFNGFAILWGQHYHFHTIIVLFSIIMYTLELYLSENKKIPLIISLILLAIRSPYFMYQVTIYIFLYSIFRYIYKNKFSKKLLKIELKLLGVYFLALGISAVIFLPICYLILNNPRVGQGFYLPNMVFSSNEIAASFIRLFSNNIMGTFNYLGPFNYYELIIFSSSVIVIILLPQIFVIFDNHKKRNLILLSIIASIIASICPIVSYVFNGFSAIATRWSFIIIFTLLINLGIILKYIIKREKGNAFLIDISGISSLFLLFMAILKILLAYNQRINKNTIFGILIQLTFICLVFLLLMKLLKEYIRERNSKYINGVILLVSLEIVFNSYITVNNRVTLESSYINNKKGYYDNTNDVIKFLNEIDQGYYRVDKEYYSQFLNDSLFQNYWGIKSYTPLNNKNYLEFYQKLNVNRKRKHVNYIEGFNGSNKILSFLGVKYLLTKDIKNSYNYELIKKVEDVNIYLNKYALPLGFSYDQYITRKEFDELNIEEKEEALLNSLVVEDEINNLNKYNVKNIMQPYMLNIRKSKVENVDVISKSEKYIEYKATNSDPMMILNLKSDSNYTEVKMNVDAKCESTGQLFYKKEKGNFSEKNSFRFKITPGNKEYNLKVKSESISDIRIDIGVINEKIKISEINVLANKSSSGREYDYINSQDKFTINSYEDSKIKGEINSSSDKILFLSIPYDKGWKARRNGNYVQLKKGNIGFMYIDIKEGSNVIELEYTPPFLLEGLIISLFSLIVLLLIYSKKIILFFKKNK